MITPNQFWGTLIKYDNATPKKVQCVITDSVLYGIFAMYELRMAIMYNEHIILKNDISVKIVKCGFWDQVQSREKFCTNLGLSPSVHKNPQK